MKSKMRGLLTISTVLLVCSAPCVKAESLDVTEQVALVGGLLACVTLILSSVIVYLFLTVLKVRGQVLEFAEIQQLRLQHLENGPTVQFCNKVHAPAAMHAAETDLAARETPGQDSVTDSNKQKNDTKTKVQFSLQHTESYPTSHQGQTPTKIETTRESATLSYGELNSSSTAVSGHQILDFPENSATPRSSGEVPAGAEAEPPSSTPRGSTTGEYHPQSSRGSFAINSQFEQHSINLDSNYRDLKYDRSIINEPHPPPISRRSLGERGSQYSKSNRGSFAQDDSQYFFPSSSQRPSRVEDEPPYLHTRKKPPTRDEQLFHHPPRGPKSTYEPRLEARKTSPVTDHLRPSYRERESLSYESEHSQRNRSSITVNDGRDGNRRLHRVKRKLHDNMRASS